ncbi:MAG: Ig-like domain-containing protein, partial [Planctomycetales bacterium]
MIQVAFSDAMNEATVVDPSNYTLVASGGDAIFGNGNDVDLTSHVSGITWDATAQVASLSLSVPLAVDVYLLTLNSPAIRNTSGTALFATPIPLVRGLGTIPTQVSVDLVAASDSGVSSTDNLTNDNTPTFAVTVNKPGTIGLDLDNNGTVDLSQAVNAPGIYSFTAPGLADGIRTVRAALTPLIGDSAEATLVLRLDTQAPKLLAGSTDEYAPLDHRVLHFSEEIDQSIGLGSNLRLTGPGGANVPLTTASGSGDSFTITFADLTVPGDYVVTADQVVRDLAGNLITAAPSDPFTVHKISWDAGTDFSLASNPFGDWQYGWSTSVGSTFNLYSDHQSTSGLDSWHANFAGQPMVVHNSSASTVTITTVSFPTTGLVMHPGPGGQVSVVRWTAPASGLISLSAIFSGCDFVGPTSTDVHVLRNGVSLFESSIAGFGPASESSFSSTIAVSIGDTIDFCVGFGNGNYFYDSTGVDAKIVTLGTIPTLVNVDLVAASDSGISSTDNLTNDNTPTFDVTVNKPGTINLDFDNDGTTDLSQVVNASGSYSFTAPGLADGIRTLRATLDPLIGDAAEATLFLRIDTQAPALLVGNATEQAPADRRQARFSESIDTTIGFGANVKLTGPGGTNIPLTGITGDGTNFTIAFGSIISAGQYVLSADQVIRDLAGNLIGSAPHDEFTLLADLTPPTVVSVSPVGIRNTDVSTLRVTLSETMDAMSFTAGDVVVDGPNGVVAAGAISVSPVDAPRRVFDITIPTQSAEGEYVVTLGPNITDLAGNPLEKATSFSFTIDKTGPRVLSATPIGLLQTSTDHVDVTFNETLGRLRAADVVLTGPDGAIAVGPPTFVSGTTYRIPFARQSVSGDYALTIGPGVLDLAGNALDQDADGTQGETGDDSFTTTFSLALADLIPEQLSAPATAVAGQKVTVTWKTLNLGTSAGAIPVTERVWLSDDQAIGNDRFIGEFTFPDVGDRSVEITLPTYGQGSGGLVYLVVETDVAGTVSESSESNNAAIAAAPIDIPLELHVTLPASQVREDASSPLRGVVMRNGSTTSALTVTLASSDTSELTVPASVVIPAGQSGVAFLAMPVADSTPDGHQLVTVSATAGGFAAGITGLTVLDVDKGHLTLDIPVDELTEGSSATVTVTREVVTDQPLLVSLSGSSATQLSLPSSVVIPANAASVTFTITALDDVVPEPAGNVSIVASATGSIDGGDSALIIDNDTPELSFSLNRTQVAEGTANPAVSATSRRTVATSAPLTVRIDVSNPSVVQAPATVVIPAGQLAVTFALNVVNNALVDGDRLVTLDAYGTYPADGSRITDSKATRTVTITDDDGPTLSLALDRQFVGEGIVGAAHGTVTRNTATTEPLIVALASSLDTEALVPLQVTIPAGATSVEFAIDTVADGVTDGTRQVTLSASAAGFSGGSALLSVSDQNVPDLVVSEVTVPADAVTDTFVDVGFRITNVGLAPAAGTITQTLYLSSDGVFGDDTLLNSYTFTGTLQASQPLNTFAQTVPVRLPKQAGTYWIFVTTDSLDAVLEGVETNNTRVSAMPIVVQPAYHATVEADLVLGLANTPVELRGQARDTLGNAPTPFVLVNIDLTVRGFRRTISAITDSNGYFRTTFKPLPGEAGRYGIAAYHPGDTPGDPQDYFTLVGMAADPAKPAVKLIEGADATAGQVTIRNLSEVAMTGLNVEIVSGPGNVVATATLGDGSADQTLLGSGTLTLAYTLQATDDSLPGGSVLLHLTSAEGAPLDVPVAVEVVALRPKLTASVERIQAGMLHGKERPEQRLVQFTVTNDGGRESGPLELRLPDVPWMLSATGIAIASMQPGQSTTIVLQLLPATDLPLGDYTGALVIAGATDENATVSLSVPFTIRNLSDAAGDLEIEVVDEYTYYAEGSPKVVEASVTVTDATTGRVIFAGTSDENGRVAAADLREGYYEIRVDAEKHGSFTQTHLIEAGTPNSVLAFLPRQAVRYIWTVTSAEVADRTKITITSDFETNVPMPVVVVDPPLIDLFDLTKAGQTMTVMMTIRNEGLIGADSVTLHFDSNSVIEIIPLIEEVDRLEAKSSLQIPVLIRRNAIAPTHFNGVGVAAADAVPCQISGYARYKINCGPDGKWYSIPIQVVPPADALCPIGQGGGGGSTGGATAGGRGAIGAPFVFAPVYESTATCECEESGDFLVVGVDAKKPKAVKVYYRTIPSDATLYNVTFIINGQVKATVPSVTGEFTFEFNQDDLKYGTNNISLQAETCNNKQIYREFQAYRNRHVATDKDLGVGTIYPYPEVYQRVYPIFGLNVTYDRVSYTVPTINPHSIFLVDVDAFLKIGREPQVFLGITEWGVDASVVDSDGSHALPALEEPKDQLSDPAFNEEERLAEVDQWFSSESDVTVVANTSQISLDGIIGQVLFVSPYPPIVGSVLWDVEVSISGDSATGESGSQSDGDSNVQPQPSITDSADSGVCARVQLQTSQEVTVIGDAISVAATIFNDDPEVAETGLVAQIEIRNSAGTVVTNRFEVRIESLAGVDSIEGSGTIAPDSRGAIKWLVIPGPLAATERPTEYFVSGILGYSQGERTIAFPLPVSRVTVFPNPMLTVNYFHQRDVLSDDPFTDEVEPSQPYNLAVQIQNSGFGVAKDVSITSAQPQIVDNEKGLLIDFQIIGTEVNGQNLNPSLTANFGQIDAGEIVQGRWLLTSTLQGQFIDYKATFEHVDSLGDKRLSLIDSVDIHEMIHLVQAGGTYYDGKFDYLVNDIADEHDTPDTLWLSDGRVESVETVTDAVLDGAPVTGDLTVELTATVGAGWNYIDLPDLANGKYRLAQIVRDDGFEVLIGDNVTGGNAWQTDRTFIEKGRRPILENRLHLLDFGGSGHYTVRYSPVDTVGPTVTELTGASGLVTDAVDTLTATFTEPLLAGSFELSDLALYRNDDSTNLITSTVSIVALSATQYQIAGLAALTGPDAAYRFEVRAAGVADEFGNLGTGFRAVEWTKADSAPTVTSIIGPSAARVHTAVNEVNVSFSRELQADSFGTADLVLTRDGTTIDFSGSSLTFTQTAVADYRIAGLALFTASEGNYTLTVLASGVVSATGLEGVGSQSIDWTMDTTGPQVSSIVGLPSGLTNQALDSMDVTFSELLGADTFTVGDVRLTRGSQAVSTAGLSVSSLGDGRYRVTGLGAITVLDGSYELTIGGGDVADVAGNAGIGQLTQTWQIDRTAPPAATGLAFSPDTGLVGDKVTNVLSGRITGQISEMPVAIAVYDDTIGSLLGTQLTSTGVFDIDLAFDVVGNHELRVVSTDAAGNSRAASYILFIDQTPPFVAEWGNVPTEAGSTAPDSIDIAFTEAVAEGALDPAALILSRDNGPNLLPATPSILKLDPRTFRLSGLAGLVATDGVYRLSVDTQGLHDLAGNAGTGVSSVEWQFVSPPPPAELSGTLWDDRNENRAFDTGEPLLVEWTVFLDADRDGALDAGEISTVTDTNGVYRFQNLPAGTYVVAQVLPEGWKQTFPGTSPGVGEQQGGSSATSASSSPPSQGRAGG